MPDRIYTVYTAPYAKLRLIEARIERVGKKTRTISYAAGDACAFHYRTRIGADQYYDTPADAWTAAIDSLSQEIFALEDKLKHLKDHRSQAYIEQLKLQGGSDDAR